jgi:hypothetical protein
MQKLRLTGATLLILAAATIVAGQGFKTYPGAKKFTPDSKETKEVLESLPAGTEISVYLTDDSFEKVVAFYRGFAKEYTMPMPRMPKSRKLPNGQELKQVYFIFDGAADIMTSKNWAQIQRPFIGSMDDKFQPHDIRDVTKIEVTKMPQKK